jgi:hypothetical protein
MFIEKEQDFDRIYHNQAFPNSNKVNVYLGINYFINLKLN